MASRIPFLPLILLLLSGSTAMAQNISRSGFPADLVDYSQFRRFPCGDTVFFEEPFDSIPAGWQVWDIDMLEPKDEIKFLVGPGWQNVYDFKDLDSINRLMASPSWYEDDSSGNPLKSDDWLVSPLINLNERQSVCLSWYAYSQDQFFPESYELRIATAPEIDSFMARPPIFVDSLVSSDVNYESVAIPDEFLGKHIHLAWRQISNDKFIMALDDIRLSEVFNPDVALFLKKSDTVFVDNGGVVTVEGWVLNAGLDTLIAYSDFVEIVFDVDTLVRADTLFPDSTIFPFFTMNDTLGFLHRRGWIPPIDDTIYTQDVWVNFTGDANPSNDTIHRIIVVGEGKLPTALNDDLLMRDIRYYPNPAGTFLYIESDDARAGRLEVEVLDLMGRQALPPQIWERPAGVLRLDLQSLIPGLYLLRLRDENGRRFSGKFYKE